MVPALLCPVRGSTCEIRNGPRLMRTFPRPSVLVCVAAVAVAAAALLGLAGWPQPQRTFELAGLTLAAILAAAFGMPRSSTTEWTIVPLVFVVDFAALLLLGPHAATLVAGAAAVMTSLAEPPRAPVLRRGMLNVVTVSAAVQAAGFG